jgi:acid phosphatase
MSIKRIIICADTGYINDHQKLNMKVINHIDSDFCFLLGDNFYPFGLNSIDDEQFQEKYINIFPNIPCFAILGNHDYLLNPKSQIQLSSKFNNWKMPHYFYDIILDLNQDSIHFIFLDTCILAKDLTLRLLTNDVNKYLYSNIHDANYHIQINWLKHTLQNSKSKWKIICGHYPICSNGPHQNSVNLYNLLMPIFKEYKVDCYISGHDHNLQHIFKEDIHFFVTGSFCDSYRFINKPVLSSHNKFYSEDYGFLYLEILGQKTLSFTFINSVGNIIYNHQLIK